MLDSQWVAEGGGWCGKVSRHPGSANITHLGRARCLPVSQLPANSYLKLLQSGILTQRGATHIQAEAKGRHSSYTCQKVL